MNYGPHSIITDGLVAAYDFGDHISYISGSTKLFNITTGNYTGSINGNTIITSSYSLYFSGSSQYVQFQNTLAQVFSLTQWCTIGVWVYNLNPTKAQNILCLGNPTTNNIFSIEFANDGRASVFKGTGSGGGASLMGNSTDFTNKWAYLIGGTSGSGFSTASYWTFRTYNSQSTVQRILGSSTPPLLPEITTAFIGATSAAESCQAFIGHVHFYNRWLTLEEIHQNYNSLKPRFT